MNEFFKEPKSEVIEISSEETKENVTINLKSKKSSDSTVEVKDPLKTTLGDSIHRVQGHPVNDTEPSLRSDAQYYTVTSFEVVEQKFNKERDGIIFVGANHGKNGIIEEAEIFFDEKKKSKRFADKFYTNREYAIQTAKDLTETELARAEEERDRYQSVVDLINKNLKDLRF